MRRLELCHIKLKGKWRTAYFVDEYANPTALRVMFDGNDWIVKREEFCTTKEYNQVLRSDFEADNVKLCALMRASEKPVKAKIAREINMSPSTMYHRLRKAAELGVDLSFKPNEQR
jgi:ribosomal protein S17E